MEEVEKNRTQPSSMTINNEELENFKLIWLDKIFTYSDRDVSAKLQFRHITRYLRTFFNADECFDYILNNEVDYNILIITLDLFDDDDDIIKNASSVIQITFLYIISSVSRLENNDYSKYCHSIFTNIRDLLVKLHEDVQFCTQNIVKFNIFTSPSRLENRAKL